LEHAYSLRNQLDAPWAARPLELIDRDGQMTLRAEDPRGQLLVTLLGKPWASLMRRAAIWSGNPATSCSAPSAPAI
jgi:hypothetical protein